MTTAILLAAALLGLGLLLAFATALRLRHRLRRATDELGRLRARPEPGPAAGPGPEASASAPGQGRRSMLEGLARQVAHDAAGPVTVVAANLGFVAQGLEDGTRPEELREALEEASQAIRRIQGLVRQLGDASRDLPPR